MLDTGVWSRIGADNVADDLRLAVRQHNYSIVLPPSTLLEVLRTPRRDYRDRDVLAMVHSGGKPLASDVELETTEFIHAVRRHRPWWLKPKADLKTVNRLNDFWTRGIWDLAAADSDEASRRAGVDQLVPAMVEHQRANRREFLDTKFEGHYGDLRYYGVRDVPSFGIRKGDVIEQWRVDLGLFYWHHLAPQFRASTDSTMRDWCGAYLDLDRLTLSSSDFGELWIKDIEASEVKRDWLQSAVRWSQTHRRIVASNPADEQHSAYLIDADVFMTTDRKLVDVIHEVQSYASFEFARPVLIDRETPGSFIDHLMAAVE